MFSLFKKKNPIESEIKKLESKYQKLQKEAFELSRSDRKASDLKTAEAEEVIKKIEDLKKQLNK